MRISLSLLHRLALLSLLMISCGLVIATYSVFNYTWDEPEHLAAGMAFVDTGSYPFDVQHPPLARIAMAVGPYLAGARSQGNSGPYGEQEGRDILYHSGRPEHMLAFARAGMLPFLIVLIMVTWFWTRHVYGNNTAIIAALFVAMTPPLLGHAAVAALDLPVTAMIMLALYLFFRWQEHPTLQRAIMFGIAAGLAVATKLSAIPFIACTLISWIVIASWLASRTQPAFSVTTFVKRLLQHVALMVVIAGITLIICYGWRWEPWSAQMSLPVPVGLKRIIASLDALTLHNDDGHLAYFLGEVSYHGWWQYYFVVLGVKTPLPLLLLGTTGLLWCLYKGWQQQHWQIAAPALAIIAILIFSSSYSQINIGVRHVLIIFPLLAMLAAVTFNTAWQHWRSPVFRSVLILLLGWQVLSVVRTHPDHLAYFNELAASHPEHIVVDSDLDWGQDIRRLAQELKRRHINEISILYLSTADLSKEGLPNWHKLKAGQPVSGWVAVSLFARYTTTTPEDYAWLDKYQPVTRVGKSIDLFYIQ